LISGIDDKIKEYIDYSHPMFIGTNKNDKDYRSKLRIWYPSH
jgi:hypothetical protein